MPSLYDLAARLQAFVAGEATRDELDEWLAPVLAADPLDVAESAPKATLPPASPGRRT